MIGQPSRRRILDFANRNVGVGCGNVHIWDPEQHDEDVVNSGVTKAGVAARLRRPRRRRRDQRQDRGRPARHRGLARLRADGPHLPAVLPDLQPGQPGPPRPRRRRPAAHHEDGPGPRSRRFTVDLATKQLDLDSEVVIFQYDAQIWSCCHQGGGMGFDSRGQPLRHHRRLQLVAAHERLLGQLPARALSDRRPTWPPTTTAAPTASRSTTRAAPPAAPTTTTARCCASTPSTRSPTGRSRRSASTAPTRCRTRSRPTARTCSAAPRAPAARPSRRSTRWACATRRACSSTPRPTSRTRRGSAPMPASRPMTQGPSTYENATQLPEAGNYGWPYCMGNQQAYRDRVADGSLRTTNAAGFVSGGPAASPTQGWYDCNNLVNDSTNNTGLTVLPHQTGTGKDAGRARPLNLWYSRGNPGGANGCPNFPRELGPNNAPNYGAPHPPSSARTSPLPARRSSTAPSTAMTTRPRTTRRAGPSTGTAAGSSRTSATTAPSTACCSTPPPTRTAASRSTPTACAAS